MSSKPRCGWLSYPVRPGYFQELDRLAETTTDLVDLVGDLLATRVEDAAREAEVWNAGERARREACRFLGRASGVAFGSRLFELVQSQGRVLRSIRKVSTRLWSCTVDPTTPDAQAAADGAIALSAISGELRAAIRCLASAGRRSEARAHCQEVRRLSRISREIRPRIAPLAEVDEPAALSRAIAWADVFHSMAHASRACVDAAGLVEIVAAEA